MPVSTPRWQEASRETCSGGARQTGWGWGPSRPQFGGAGVPVPCVQIGGLLFLLRGSAAPGASIDRQARGNASPTTFRCATKRTEHMHRPATWLTKSCCCSIQRLRRTPGFLWFDESGPVEPNPFCCINYPYRRATASIELYHLKHTDLVEWREVLCSDIHRSVEDADSCLAVYDAGDGTARRVFGNTVRGLRERLAPSAPYSAAARHVGGAPRCASGC